MSIQNISSVIPGMVLIEDVLTEKGFKLLPKGIKLTENHISIMKQWGITEIHVDDFYSDKNPSVISKKTLDQSIKIRDEIENLFSAYDAKDVIREFERITSRFEFYNGIDFSQMTEKWSE